MSKQQEAWNAFASGLSPLARTALTADKLDPLLITNEEDSDDATDAYQTVMAALSPGTSEALAKTGGGYVPPKQIAVEKAKYCLVEIPDGDWPRLRVYSTPEAMAKRITNLAGFDVSVWCYYGIPLKVSKGPQRFVELPSGYQLMRIPPFPGVEPTVVNTDEVDELTWEKRGFVGPSYLADALPTEADQVPATAGGDEDDD